MLIIAFVSIGLFLVIAFLKILKVMSDSPLSSAYLFLISLLGLFLGLFRYKIKIEKLRAALYLIDIKENLKG